MTHTHPHTYTHITLARCRSLARSPGCDRSPSRLHTQNCFRLLSSPHLLPSRAPSLSLCFIYMFCLLCFCIGSWESMKTKCKRWWYQFIYICTHVCIFTYSYIWILYIRLVCRFVCIYMYMYLYVRLYIYRFYIYLIDNKCDNRRVRHLQYISHYIKDYILSSLLTCIDDFYRRHESCLYIGDMSHVSI